ncbi:hypothetical protein [Myceligenerans xiligouense]|uniref:EF-hand domain-containing protein n=1 Tax=Myceligenerans xiligouense TaxID=253184 RepID=A0A3N4YRJ5_9MICO|nr:hypothetical protein [Myceligenerans xiligouense]RPF22166.1 hypothetical protein EDD34_2814 [Myceligenerans xiligouense]
MWWSVLLLVVCLLLAAGVFLVANVMDAADGNQRADSFPGRFRAGWHRVSGGGWPKQSGRVKGASAVATHAVGAPSVWVGKPGQGRRPDEAAPVDMEMSEFFQATVEDKPGYMDAEELQGLLGKARDQATKAVNVPIQTVKPVLSDPRALQTFVPRPLRPGTDGREGDKSS